MPKKLTAGLYDKAFTEGNQHAVEKDPSLRAHTDKLQNHTGVRLLSQHLNQLIERALAGQSEENRVELANDLIRIIEKKTRGSVAQQSDFVTNAWLKELARGVQAHTNTQTIRPGIPLSHSELLTNAPSDHRIGYELKREIESADRIDILIAFIKWSGLRLVREALQDFVGRGGGLRVITTTYMKATERQAIDELIQIGAKIKISYDTRRTRLHAKAWLLHRNTGFSTAFVGSSNLSAAAQLDGLEWNVRLSKVDAGRIIDKIEAAFNSYWEDVEFEIYDGSQESQKRFDAAVEEEPRPGRIMSLEVHPYPFQQEILDKLDVERTIHGRTRNLVVAATGTGKTVMAALDYRRLARQLSPLRLLFVAHRAEILQQARTTFRDVLKHNTFGEDYVGGSQPQKWDHVFASVQSLANFDLDKISPKHFGMIIIDEFHHAAAKTYQRLLEHFQSHYLLGLTATPERADGKDILSWFGGRVAAELRVWDAIDRGLLVPFHYFGRHDGGDLSSVRWVRGKYDDSELTRLFTADDIRVRKILKVVKEHIANPLEMRALGFCVSVSHAEFMTRKFDDAGIPAACITGKTPRGERINAQNRLRKGEVNILFSVDVLGEGVDIPPVDTILMLRPTNSATVFIQQLGRGLRFAEGKTCLTVLDFISNSARQFRFDYALGAMLGKVARKSVKEAVEKDFPALPSGCSLLLDQESKDVVLNNLRTQLRYRSSELERLLRHLGDRATLKTFLDKAELSIEDFYSKKPNSFTLLCRRAGISTADKGPDETEIGSRLRLLIHADDAPRLNFIRQAAKGDLNMSGLSERDRRRLLMLVCALLGGEAAFDLSAGYNKILDHLAICKELISLTDLLKENIAHTPSQYAISPYVPLELHTRYSLQEIASAFNLVGKGGLLSPREGIRFDEATSCNLIFVTIHKNEKYYASTAMYRDYVIDAHHFHWQSQNNTRSDMPKGRRHTHHKTLGITPLIFARTAKKTDYGLTMPYQFLGPASYLSHEGEQPMSIIWKMKYPIPADIVRNMRLAA
ncbi:MAG: DUF3427 domain-containing protein [Rhodothermaceae bacterium]|nr:DUF3427 domain-containing protein [Rhodothermaceae bacterium]MYF63015.1 DUF3427 domain-containing protein [Rhodothermaceae bacterium]MYI83766.1 DUF3427 domain-containing protein [Rhodothermaceae bacterium]